MTPPAVEPDERSVLEALAAGDLGALEEVLRAYWGPVAAYASRILDDTEAGRDVAQETFIRIWGNAARWRAGSLSGLVFRVARNLCVDELRRRGARDRALAGAGEIGSPPPRRPDEILEHERLVAAVDEAIQSLPDRRREAFTLTYLQGLSYSEVGEVMGISTKTVGNQIVAALAELRQRLLPLLNRDRQS